VPLRACVSRDVDNLMFAGRNISATHCAFGSTRVMATCAAIGQGVGVAAAYAAANGLAPTSLTTRSCAMHAIQQQLLRDDCYLIGITNEDENDKARIAAITTCSGDGAQIITGQTRSVHGSKGALPDRSNPGIHRWISRSLSAWLQMSWPKPIIAGTIQLIFDTGLSNVLTLSYDDAYTSRMRWGVAQPQCVRDYLIETFCGDKCLQQINITGNYQRLRVHDLSCQPVDALRITVTATNGIDCARICEVRVY